MDTLLLEVNIKYDAALILQAWLCKIVQIISMNRQPDMRIVL